MPLSVTLQKSSKTLEDALYIYESIRSLRFFDSFFAQNMRTLDFDSILALCQGFKYEKFSMGKFVFKKGDKSNQKFYILLSGEAGVILPTKKLHKKQKSSISRLRGAILSAIDLSENCSPVTTSFNNSIECLDRELANSKKKVLQTYARQSPVMSQPRLEPIGSFSHLETIEGDYRASVDDFDRSKNSVDELLYEPEKFEEFASKIGKFVRYLHEGDGFGELALRDDSERTASILCKTDCEFMVMTKKQFDVIFGKKEKEKEELLATVFPFLYNVISYQEMNFFLFSFKTQAYSRGSYLTIEGKNSSMESPIFFIQHGECLVEKNLCLEKVHPTERSKKIATNSAIQITVIGKCMIVGEEILMNGEEYAYSVKALSENVIVYAISKRDFQSKPFQQFYQHVTTMYEKKKRQREIIYETLRTDLENKMEKQVLEKDFIKAPPLNNLVTKPAITSITKQFSRGKNMLAKSGTSALLKTQNSPKGYSTANLDFTTPERRTSVEPEISRASPIQNKSKVMSKEVARLIKLTNVNKPKIDIPKKSYLPSVKNSESVESPELKDIKLFDENWKKAAKYQRASIRNFNQHLFTPHTTVAATTTTIPSTNKAMNEPIGVILKKLHKGSQKFKRQNQTLVDVKGARKYGDDVEEEDYSKFQNSNSSSPKSIAKYLMSDKDFIPSLADAKIENFSPLNASPTFSTKATQAYERDCQGSPQKLETIMDMKRESQIPEFKLMNSNENLKKSMQRPDTLQSRTNRVAKIPKLSIKTSSLVELDTDSSLVLKSPKNVKTSLKMVHNQSRASIMKISSNPDINESPLLKADRSPNREKGKALSPEKSSHNTRLINLSEWRKKIFQKTSKRPDSVRGGDHVTNFQGTKPSNPK